MRPPVEWPCEVPGAMKKVNDIQSFHRAQRRLLLVIILVLLFISCRALAQQCQQDSDIDPATHTALVNSSQLYLQMAARGDVATLKQNAIASLAGNFGAIQQAVTGNQANLTGPATVQHVYLLDASTETGTIANAQFFCGVFGAYGNTANSASFQIPNLPAGKYALVMQSVTSSTGPFSFSLVLQNVAGQWKIAGLYVHASMAGGHDSQWFLARARDFKQKDQLLASWLYYYMAWNLEAPVNFMSTLVLDRISSEMQGVHPPDLPGTNPVTLTSPQGTYTLTEIFPLVDNGKLDLIVKYSVPDLSDNVKLYHSNLDVMQALLAKHPELRDAFDQIVARAVAPDGSDFGTAMDMKDVKSPGMQ